METTDRTKPSQTHKTKQPTPHLLLTEVEQEEDKTMDVTFVLEESGVTATVEVPCEADVAAAKEVACTALAVSPASVEMRIGTQVLEGTCRLQDTAFDAGMQVVLACPRLADIKCPAEYTVESPPGRHRKNINLLSLSPCGALCLFRQDERHFTGLDTETFSLAFKFKSDIVVWGAPAISRCKTHCYMADGNCLAEVALPGGEVLRKVDGSSGKVFACGSVVVTKGKYGVSVYDEDLTLLRSLSHEGCRDMAVSDCGGWVITSSEKDARLWDVNTGEAVACVPADGWCVALSRPASVFAVLCSNKVQLYDWSGAALGCFKEEQCDVAGVQFTPCGKYAVVRFLDGRCFGKNYLHQYDVATMSCVRVIQDSKGLFEISPCSRVIMFVFKAAGGDTGNDVLVARHLYPY